jgi:hypothetical protein
VEQGHGQGQGQHVAIEPNVISVADAARMLNMSMGTIRYRIKQEVQRRQGHDADR